MAVQQIPVTDRGTWLELRRRDLTASDVAAVAGLDPRKSALSVYEDKIGMSDGIADNQMLRGGRWLEAAVIAAVADMRPDWQVRKAAVYLRDPETRLGATPDAFAMIPDVGLANVQCKVVALPEFEEHWQDEGVPAQYAVQTAVESGLADTVTGYLAVLVIGTYYRDLALREVPRHPAAERRAAELAVSFWEHVAAGVPPPVDMEKDQALIAALPASPGKEIDLSTDPEIRQLLLEHERLDMMVGEFEKDRAYVDTAIRLKLGDAEVAFVPGWRLTWKESKVRPHFVGASKKRQLRIGRG